MAKSKFVDDGISPASKPPPPPPPPSPPAGEAAGPDVQPAVAPAQVSGNAQGPPLPAKVSNDPYDDLSDEPVDPEGSSEDEW